MDSEETRTDYEQAIAILNGTSMLLPTIAHLRALDRVLRGDQGEAQP